MIKIDGVNLSVGYTEDEIKEKCAKRLKISSKSIVFYEIIKLSLDARRKNDIKYNANIALSLNEKLEDKYKSLKYEIDKRGLEYSPKKTNFSPIVVGFGPSGIFAGLTLARMGLKPIIIEQGKCVEERQKDVEEFWNKGKLNKYSNVQFGEGGAGTFSDGKLNSNISNTYTKKVINELYNFGAPKEITYLSKPHIGSDNLRKIVKNIRQEIINLGGNVFFSHKMIDISIKNDKLTGITIKNLLNDSEEYLQTNHLLLCLGHSARDSFEMLYSKNLTIKQKPFAMGVRIEQSQNEINDGQYGKDYDKRLPPADYKLVVHLPNGRNVFTFCMCPGGYVVASSSNDEEIVTNGMSNFARNGDNANSALLVNVTPEDFGSNHPLAGIYYQAKYEKLAYKIGGGNFVAPAQKVCSFLGNSSTDNGIETTYRPSIKLTDISKCLPDYITKSLKEALPLLNNKLSGFAKDNNLLIAIESRSSCPLTIVRDENYESNIKGIYPIGEGAGYAGGIITSAQDGVKVAEMIYNKLD